MSPQTHHSEVMVLTFGPELDGPERQPKALLLGNETEDGVCHSAAVQAPHTLGVKVPQQGDVQEVEVVGNGSQG